MSAWCAANQCSISQMKYWLYKSKIGKSSPASTGSAPAARFVPLSVTDQTGAPLSAPLLVVRIGQVSIELHPGFNPKLLREVVHALKSSC
ncbi:IS66 family insertion sequence element accessory protein TnpA [Brevibacillus sp. WF146]|uniref:IS66 family insertion sequence element accessory protein TnpA n=1 Tax=Brevibacillus sp. WF146 TaxID=319501 RepID=UPI0039B37EB5